jgi:hypothetical protein
MPTPFKMVQVQALVHLQATIALPHYEPTDDRAGLIHKAAKRWALGVARAKFPAYSLSLEIEDLGKVLPEDAEREIKCVLEISPYPGTTYELLPADLGKICEDLTTFLSDPKNMLLPFGPPVPKGVANIPICGVRPEDDELAPGQGPVVAHTDLKPMQEGGEPTIPICPACPACGQDTAPPRQERVLTDV